VTPFSSALFISTLALIGAGIGVPALLSGWIERSVLPKAVVFPHWARRSVRGAGAVHGAVNLREVRECKLLAFLVVGPGTMPPAALVALAGWRLLDLPVPLAAVLGAALAPAGPALLRGFIRRPEIDPRVRQALRLESGMNDSVLLSVVLAAIAVTQRGAGFGAADWLKRAAILVLSPAAGVAVWLGAVAALEFVRKRLGGPPRL
jgi:NhaP-type Na+/H+ or K+/H+ antiporter